MPRETKEIRLVSPRLITSVDSRDIPDEAVSDAQNIDLNSTGKVTGIRGMGDVYSASDDRYNFSKVAWCSYDDDTHDLVVYDSIIRYIENFYSSGTISNYPTTYSDSFYDYIQLPERTILSRGNDKSPLLIYKRKNNFSCTVEESSAGRRSTCWNVIFDASEATSSTTLYVRFFHSGESYTMDDFTITQLSNGCARFTAKSSLGSFPHTWTKGQYLSYDIEGERITEYDEENGGWKTETVKVSGVLKITGDDSGGSYSYIDTDLDIGDYTDIDSLTLTGDSSDLSFNYDTLPGVSSTGAEDVVVGKWHTLTPYGVKLKVIRNEGISNEDELKLNITVNSSIKDITEAPLNPDDVDVTAEISYSDTQDAENFLGDHYYYIGYSVIAYGEESPIKLIKKLRPIHDANKLDILLNINNVSELQGSKSKYDAIVLYGAVGTQEDMRGSYRVIRELPFNAWHWEYDSSTSSVQTTLTTEGDWSETYESRNGVSDSLDTLTPNWRIGAIYGGYLFVTDAQIEDLDSPIYLFRSQVNAYNTFDWTRNIIRLPEKPTAIAPVGGRIWVFSENKLVKINPNMYIEDIVEGIGCKGQDNIVVTDFGVFWNDNNNAYMSDGNTVQIISKEIQNSFGASTIEMVGYIPNEHCVAFLKYSSSGGLDGYLFYLDVQGWMRVNFPSSGRNGIIFPGKKGEIYLAYYTLDPESYIKKLMHGETKLDWEFTTKTMDFGEQQQDKKFYYLKVNGSVSNVSYSLDGGSYVPLTLTDNTAELKSGGQWLRGRDISFKFSGSGTLYGMEVIFRRLIGKHG